MLSQPPAAPTATTPPRPLPRWRGETSASWKPVTFCGVCSTTCSSATRGSDRHGEQPHSSSASARPPPPRASPSSPVMAAMYADLSALCHHCPPLSRSAEIRPCSASLNTLRCSASAPLLSLRCSRRSALREHGAKWSCAHPSAATQAYSQRDGSAWQGAHLRRARARRGAQTPHHRAPIASTA